jgi:hypothetical protein
LPAAQISTSLSAVKTKSKAGITLRVSSWRVVADVLRSNRGHMAYRMA